MRLEPRVVRWLHEEGLTIRAFRHLLWQYVCVNGGEIDQQAETREMWRDQWEFHYDLRPVINATCVYVETRLYPESLANRDEPILYVVNVHRA